MTRTAGKLLKKKSQKLQWEDAPDSTMTADRSRTLFMDYGDDEDEKKSLDEWEKEEEEEMRRQKQREEEEKEAEASNAFMAKVQTMLNKAASPEPEVIHTDTISSAFLAEPAKALCFRFVCPSIRPFVRSCHCHNTITTETIITSDRPH